MACFIVPATGAVIAKVSTNLVKKKEKKVRIKEDHLPFSVKLSWLTRLLGGGSFLLAFEHLWHGEIVPWFPFLTAMKSPESSAEMVQEMATTGVAMLLLCLAVWGLMLLVTHQLEKKAFLALEAA
jgi:hypothetical protein